MKQIRILIFPCGSEIGLELHSALKDVSFITLIGASSIADHGKFIFANYTEGLPYVNQANFLAEFNQLLERERIDFIYPAMDEVMDVLSENRDQLKAKLIAPEHAAVHICRSKARTYKTLHGLNFLPKIYTCAEDVDQYPVIIKPEEGYGSKGFKILRTYEELLSELSLSNVPNVICEYLSGEEYTVDCFTNRHGVLQYTSCRSRNRVRNGISVNSKIQSYDYQIEQIAYQISKRIAMRGAWFFQLKRNGAGDYKLLEVATRVAGTMCVQRATGVNLPLLSVFDMIGYNVEIACQFDSVEVDRALYNAFHLPVEFSEVYLDFDDTIIVHNSVNSLLMHYLYQCINRGVSLKLITKHKGNLEEQLKKFRISSELFDEIVHIDSTQKKSDFICPKPNALFLDDSFSERLQIQEVHKITALGIDSIEALIDYRQ